MTLPHLVDAERVVLHLKGFLRRFLRSVAIRLHRSVKIHGLQVLMPHRLVVLHLRIVLKLLLQLIGLGQYAFEKVLAAVLIIKP